MFLTQPAFVISAPSGTGKESVIRRLMQTMPNLHLVRSWTTRSPRPNDSDKYVYVSEEEFKAAANDNQFLEWEYYGDHLYGTYLKDAPRDSDLIIEIDYKGALNLKAKYGMLVTTIFLLPPSREVLERRLRDRGTNTAEDIERRMKIAPKEMEHAKHFENWIENDQLEDAVSKLRFIINTKRNQGRVAPTYQNPFTLDRVLRTFQQSAMAN